MVVIAGVMHTRMAQGKSVHITGINYFRYTLDTVGVDSLEAFDFEKQVKAVRMEFILERTKLANGTYTRVLVDSDQLKRFEFSLDAKNSDPAQDDDDKGVGGYVGVKWKQGSRPTWQLLQEVLWSNNLKNYELCTKRDRIRRRLVGGLMGVLA